MSICKDLTRQCATVFLGADLAAARSKDRISWVKSKGATQLAPTWAFRPCFVRLSYGQLVPAIIP